MKNLIFCISFVFHTLLLVFIVSFQSNYLFAQNFSNIQKVVEAPRSFPSNRDNHFGHSVSIDGNFAIVGVPGGNSAGNTFGGVAYIYEKINTGWVLRQRLVSNDSSSSNKFGWSVSIKGDLAVVGDPDYNIPQNITNSVGRAYIFQRNTSGIWVQVSQLNSTNPDPNGQFGYSVSIEANHAVVGQYGSVPGRTYVFSRISPNWLLSQTLLGDNPTGGFGVSVDIDNDKIIVGQGFDNFGNTNTSDIGSAFIFENNNGIWTMMQKLYSNDSDPNDFFGWSVAISQDRAIVGSYPHVFDQFGNDSIFWAGAAYIFREDNGNWPLEQKIVASDRNIETFNSFGNISGAVFGFDVDISKNQIVVGSFAASKDSNGQNYVPMTGACYIFIRDQNLQFNPWTETQKLVGLHRDESDQFGVAVGISENNLVIGSNLDDDNEFGLDSIRDAGSVYFFDYNCPLTITKRLVSSNPSINQLATYEIEVCNPCGIALTNIRITDTLPADLSLGLTTNNFTYFPATRHFERNVTIPANACIIEKLSVILNRDADSCLNPIQITNCANAFSLGSNISPFVQSCHTLTTAPANSPVSNTTNLLSTLISNNVLLPLVQAQNTAQNIIVSGTLIVDVPDYFFASGSLITMEAGAQIIILPNNQLVFSNSTIQNDTLCNFMWRSITVEGGARLFLEGTTLIGGQYAVEALNKSFIYIQRCDFRDNFIGIYVPPATFVNPQQIFLATAGFNNNIFKTVNGIPKPFPGHPLLPISPVAGAMGYAGIYINDLATFDMRQPNPNPALANNFNDLATGIVGMNSTILANGCIFNNISNNNPYQVRHNGTAVFLSGQLNAFHRLEYKGYGANAQTNFNNVRRAIAVQRSGLITSDNRIRRAMIGIATRLGQNRRIGITNNSISASDIGIELFQNDAAGTRANILSNEINMDALGSNPQGQAGIFLTENNTAYPLDISTNTINLGNISNGIVIQGNSKGNIIENTIRLNQNFSFRTGLFVAGSTNSLFSCNDITGTNFNGPLNRRGFWIANTTADFSCNTADMLPVGMQFDASNNMVLRGTRFDRHFYGLWLRPGASVGNQSFGGNRFVANTPNNGRREAINQSLTVGNQFAINSPQNTPLWPSPRFPNNGWIIPGTGTDFNCNSPIVFCPTGPVLRPTPPVNNLDTLVATGAMSANNTQVNEHIGKRQLYRKLKESGNPGGLFQSFSSNEAITPVGLFDRISELSDSLCRPDSICMHNANTLQAAIAQYIAQIRQLDSLYSLNGNPQHLAQIDVLQDSLSSKTAQENLIWSNIQTTRDNTATLLDVDNSNIAVSAVFEDNEKKVNEVYLNSIAKGNADYTADQLAILQFVAGQCPWDGGNAVFRARGMLALVQRVIFNDESMCEAKSLPEDYNQGEKTVIEDIFVENDYLKLYPNPAQNYISIELQSKIDDKIESVEIFNLNGQKLKSFLNTSAQELLQIELESMSEGMYICRVIMSDNSIQTLKFSVIK